MDFFLLFTLAACFHHGADDRRIIEKLSDGKIAIGGWPIVRENWKTISICSVHTQRATEFPDLPYPYHRNWVSLLVREIKYPISRIIFSIIIKWSRDNNRAIKLSYSVHLASVLTEQRFYTYRGGIQNLSARFNRYIIFICAYIISEMCYYITAQYVNT